jgi:hypothetical protein
MEVGSLPEAECLTFRAHMGGDTLDAFAPLAQYTQRHYGGQINPLLQAGTKLASLITTGSGVVYQKIRVRDEDFVPESAGLMNLKADDLSPQEKAELMAQKMRKSKKQELISKKRELFGTRTPQERSVSPMFGGQTDAGQEDAVFYDCDAGA